MNSACSMFFFTFLVSSSLFVCIHSQADVQPDQNVSPRVPCPVTSDSLVFCEPNEHHLEHGTMLPATLPKLGKEWNVSLEFKPIDSTRLTEQANIIHISILGGPVGRMTTYGGRIVSIMTKPNQDLHFSSALTGQDGVEKNWNNNFSGTQVGEWTSIIISQQKVQNFEEDCVKYRQWITINGTRKFKQRNTAPQEFTDVKVFSSNPNFPAQPGFIRNFVIQDNTGDTVFCFVF